MRNASSELCSQPAKQDMPASLQYLELAVGFKKQFNIHTLFDWYQLIFVTVLPLSCFFFGVFCLSFVEKSTVYII